MGGSSKKQTVGYWYGLSMHMGICHGPVDAINEIGVDERPIVSGAIGSSSDVYIDKVELFGGKKREGGLQGTLSIMMGEDAQPANTSLQGWLGWQPGYRGVLTMLWRGLISANNPYLKPWSVKVKRITQGWNGGSAWNPSNVAIGTDMNPAHIVYQVHTDPDWGMGYPANSINIPNFQQVATTLYNESFGLSFLWNQQTSIEEFQGIVMDHIGGILRTNPRTGLFEIKLIRGDYNVNTLPEFNPSNCTLDNFQRAAMTDTINTMTVIYTHEGKDTPITVHDLANIQSQGASISKTVHYPGITQPGLATRVAMRDLRAAASPLSRIRITTTRKAWDILPGDCIVLNWPRLGIAGVVYRVLRVGLGDMLDGKIQIDASEDVYSLPDSAYIEQEPVGWTPPGADPVASPARYVAEAPYWDLSQQLSAADLAYLTTTDCYLSVTSQRPSGDSFEPTLWTRISGGTYDEIGQCQHCPAAILDGAHAINAGLLNLRSSVDLDQVEVGGYLVVGGECMRIDAVDTVNETATVSPGALDTVPKAHVDGEVVFFVDNFQTTDGVQYATGEVVQARIQTRTTRGELDVSTAPQDSVTMAGRQNRPYPPGRLRIDGQEYPATLSISSNITVEWRHRDRKQQTAYIVPQSDGNIGPEAGTTYNLRVYNGATSALIASYAGLTGTSQLVPINSAAALLHFEGTDASTTIVDESGLTWTSGGNAQIDTAQARFGGASCLFDGAGDYLASAASNALIIGAGEFTFECWVRPTDTATAWRVIAATTNYATNNGWALYQYGQSLQWWVGNSSATMNAAGALTAGAWQHIALTRSGSTARLFVNGALVATATNSTNFTDNSVRLGGGSSNYWYSGHIDEVRFITGAAIYTSAFTAPAAPLGLVGGALPPSLRVELESVRDGLTSWQTHAHTFSVT